jgi:hypothetical protein
MANRDRLQFFRRISVRQIKISYSGGNLIEIVLIKYNIIVPLPIDIDPNSKPTMLMSSVDFEENDGAGDRNIAAEEAAVEGNDPENNQPDDDANESDEALLNPAILNPPVFMHPSSTVCGEAKLYGPYPIHIGAGSVLHPGCRVEASGGPVVLGTYNVLEEHCCVRNDGEIRFFLVER